MSERFVYVIGIVGSDQPVKIGLAKDLSKRLSALQCAHHQQLEVNKTYRFMKGDLAFQMEQELHRRFAKQRLLGEWFDCTAEDVDGMMNRARCVVTERRVMRNHSRGVSRDYR